MRKFWIVLKREYAQVVKKKSFIVGLLLTPALMATIVVLPTFLARMKSSETENMAVIDQSRYEVGERFVESLKEYRLEDTTKPYYNVQELYKIDPADTTRFKQAEDSMRTLVSEKKLKYVLVLLPEPQLSDSNLFLITNSDNFTSLNRFEGKLSGILSSIRLEHSDINLSVDSVLELTHNVNLVTQDTKGESIPFTTKYFSALVFVGIMFSMILGYGQLVMRSVIEEKNSRIMEVLISSVSPFQLMCGKIVGLGAATFTQVAIWCVLGMGLFSIKGALDVDPAVARMMFDPVIVIFFVLFLIFGYLLFSTLFALIGSVVTSEKEAQSFVAPISITMILPFILGISVVQDPHSTMATVLSFIPLTAPTMTMMRVAFVAPTLTEISLFSGIVGEATLSLIVVIVSVLGMIWITSKIFRIGILMYGKRPTLPEIIKWIKY
ncbi:MAG TPA: ABC transporter permease [candidate division Zixibacteria bacterium]|nr:ABC transporter permease [candidate division Zixibacteria bacterium]